MAYTGFSTKLISNPTATACMGVFENASNLDVFQVKDATGAVVFHMNSNGSIDPPLYPQTLGVNVTSAQLKALASTPVTLIPAQGANTVVVPTRAILVYFAGSTPYTVTGADGYVYIGWGSTPTVLTAGFTLSDSPFFGLTTSQFQEAGATVPPLTLSGLVNQPVKLGIVDTLSLGNGTLGVQIQYDVITLQ